MGKTPEAKRLIVWADRELLDLPEVQDLIAKGNAVTIIEDICDSHMNVTFPHLILSRAGHYFDPSMAKMLPNAIKRARERKKVAA